MPFMSKKKLEKRAIRRKVLNYYKIQLTKYSKFCYHTINLPIYMYTSENIVSRKLFNLKNIYAYMYTCMRDVQIRCIQVYRSM